VDSLAYHVWSLLPSFCNYPVDTAESFNLLEKVLCSALSEEADLHGIICSSLQILIQQNKCVLEGSSYDARDKSSVSTERAISYYNHEVASANLKVLRSSVRNFLSVLSKVFLKSTNDPGGSLQVYFRVCFSKSAFILHSCLVSVAWFEWIMFALVVTQWLNIKCVAKGRRHA